MVFPAELNTVLWFSALFSKELCRQKGCSLYFVLQFMELFKPMWDPSAQNQVLSGLFIQTELASCICLPKACLNLLL